VNARDVTLEMIADSGLSVSALSKSMGKERSYIHTTVLRGKTFYCTTLAKVADICGYDLLVRRRTDGYEMPIDPD